MTIDQTLFYATNLLKSHQITSAGLDAEVLLSYALKKPKEYLYTYPEKELTRWQLKKFNQFIRRRARLEPVAYIIGKKEFYGLNFFVNKHVLIPRPETELLVEETLKSIPRTVLSFLSDFPNHHRKRLSIAKPDQLAKGLSLSVSIADVGTGSGCLAITLAKFQLAAKIYATDISAKALKVAQQNAAIHDVKIRWRQGDLLEPLKNCPLNIIVANLPYLDKKSTQNQELKFEPRLALAAGKDGLKFYKKLLRQIKKFHLKPKATFCEIDPRQTTAFKKLVKKYLPTYQLEIKKDLSDHDRVVIMKNVIPQHQSPREGWI